MSRLTDRAQAVEHLFLKLSNRLKAKLSTADKQRYGDAQHGTQAA